MCCLIILVIVLCFGVAMADDACKGKDIGNAGKFDFYVFEQSWPAEFCYSHKTYPGCIDPTPYQRVNLSIHGLWPNYNKQQDGSWWPQCCQDSPDNFTLSSRVISNLLTDLQLYWPNEEDVTGKLSTSLWAHEWQKHGTCTGLMQQAYMQAAMQVHNMPSIATPPVIQKSLGSTVAFTDLQQYYGSTKCTSGSDCIVGIKCKGKFYHRLQHVGPRH